MVSDLEVLAALMGLAAPAEGDIIELGVFRGRSLRCLVDHADGRTVHAVDSFCGMGEPTAKDYKANGECQYPKGKFNVGGPEILGDLLDRVTVWEGLVPEVLDGFPEDVRFSFAFVDLDHYLPTVHALEWLKPRMSPGGVIACHDYFPGKQILASPAIAEFARRHDREFAGMRKTIAWFVME